MTTRRNLSRLLVALLLLGTLVLAGYEGGTPLSDASQAQLSANIDKAKGLAGALTEEEMKCICKLIDDGKICADPTLPEKNANGNTQSELVEDTPTETKKKPVGIGISTGFGTVVHDDQVPGTAPSASWLLAATLAHEKYHWTNPNNTWTTGGGSSGSAAAGGERKVKKHTEHGAYCRTIEVLREAKKYYKGKNDSKATTGFKDHMKDTYDKELDDLLTAAYKLKEHYKEGQTESSIKEAEKTPVDIKDCDPPADHYFPPPNPADLAPEDGCWIENGPYSIGCAGHEFERETCARFGIGGLAANQPYWVGFTANDAGGDYSDAEMVEVTFNRAVLEEGFEQVQMTAGLWVLDLHESTAIRITLYVWDVSAQVDWENPAFATATRLDLEDVPLVDFRSQQNGAGHSITVASRYVVDEQDFAVEFSGPPLTQVTFVAYRLELDGDIPQQGDVLDVVMTDSNGDASATVALPKGTAMESASVAVFAEYASNTVGIMVVSDRPDTVANQRNAALVELGPNREEFHVGLASITRRIGDEQATLLFVLRHFQEGCKARIYATRVIAGVYSDSNAVQLTASAEPIGETGELGLSIPCAYTDGQAYRLTALVWPPGVPPNLAHLAEATRLDIEDVAPLFPKSTHSEFVGDVPYGATLSDTWTSRGQQVDLSVFLSDQAQQAAVSAAYVTGIDGVFGTSATAVGSPTTVLPGDSEVFELTTPAVSEVTFLRLTITYESPTQAFQTFTQTLGIVVFPSDPPS